MLRSCTISLRYGVTGIPTTRQTKHCWVTAFPATQWEKNAVGVQHFFFFGNTVGLGHFFGSWPLVLRIISPYWLDNCISPLELWLDNCMLRSTTVRISAKPQLGNCVQSSLWNTADSGSNLEPQLDNCISKFENHSSDEVQEKCGWTTAVLTSNQNGQLWLWPGNAVVWLWFQIGTTVGQLRFTIGTVVGRLHFKVNPAEPHTGSRGGHTWQVHCEFVESF